MPTINDVAREAGVAVSTVSYALSGKRPVSAATKARIDTAIKELKFSPHAGARALASARSNVIALVAPLRPGAMMPVVLEFVSGIVDAARERDFNVLLATQSDQDAISRISNSASADALVVMDVEMDDPRVAELEALRQPAALIGIPSDPGDLSCVDLDSYAAGQLAVRSLAELGHRKLALVMAAEDRILEKAGYAVRTIAGAREGAEEAHAEVVIVPCEPSFRGGVDAANQILDEHPETTAIIIRNETAVAGVLDALDRRGLSVPDDISVLAIGVRSACAGLSRDVTMIEVPGVELGRVAVELAMARLDDPDRPGEVRLIAPRVTDGGTTGPVR